MLNKFVDKIKRLILGKPYLAELERLQSISEQYSLMTENISAALAIHSSTGKINFCSPYIEVLTGYSRQDIYAQSDNFLETIAHPDDREKVARSIKVSQYGEAFQFRYRYLHKSGMLMWAETRIVPISDNSGSISAILSISIDVTGSVRYQQKVEEHNQDLKDFAYMISHDLKGPLVTVRGMLNAFMEDYGNNIEADAKSLLGHALKATDRLDALVKSVLQYAELTNMQDHLEDVAAEDILKDIVSEKEAELNKIQGQIVLDKLPVLRADRMMLYQIFTNLVGNAIKYRSPDRPLLLTISKQNSVATRLAQIEFTDNGLGIPASKVNEVFRPFQRAHGKEIEGSGIGLAAVKKLTERLGGQVSVTSTEGTGTTFVVSLPLPS